MHQIRHATLTLLLAFAAVPADASRYAMNKADVLTQDQEAPLTVIVNLEFPRAYVHTVGDAVRYALERSGYRLADTTAQEPLLQMPLPDVHRTFHDQELVTVLAALGKPGYGLVVDDFNRLVAFEALPQFKGRGAAATAAVEAKP